MSLKYKTDILSALDLPYSWQAHPSSSLCINRCQTWLWSKMLLWMQTWPLPAQCPWECLAPDNFTSLKELSRKWLRELPFPLPLFLPTRLSFCRFLLLSPSSIKLLTFDPFTKTLCVVSLGLLMTLLESFYSLEIPLVIPDHTQQNAKRSDKTEL